jgi:hypothetical protein
MKSGENYDKLIKKLWIKWAHVSNFLFRKFSIKFQSISQYFCHEKREFSQKAKTILFVSTLSRSLYQNI